MRLGAAGGAPLVELLHRPAAAPRPSGTTGLFHLALLVPDRAELAAAIRRVTESGWSFTGASDHLVSEAVYLRDPEGNGIEIYRDRDPEEWDWDDDAVRMATLPLDVEGVMGELPERRRAADAGRDRAGPRAPERRRPRGDRGVLRRHPRVRRRRRAPTRARCSSAPAATTTTSAATSGRAPGAPAPPAGAMGLDAFEVVLPHTGALDQVLAAVAEAGVPTVEDAAGTALTDPSGNRLILRAA